MKRIRTCVLGTDEVTLKRWRPKLMRNENGIMTTQGMSQADNLRALTLGAQNPEGSWAAPSRSWRYHSVVAFGMNWIWVWILLSPFPSCDISVTLMVFQHLLKLSFFSRKMSRTSTSRGCWEAEVKHVSRFSAHLDLQLALSMNSIHQDASCFSIAKEASSRDSVPHPV